MGKKEKFQAPEGLSLKDFQDIAGVIERKNKGDKNNSKIRVRKNIIKQIYYSFINNSNFVQSSNEKQSTMLYGLKEIIEKANEIEIKDNGNNKNNFIKHCKHLLMIKDKLERTIDHIQDKLNESSGTNDEGETEYYDKFRVKGGTKFLKKFLQDVVDTGNIAYSLGDMGIDDLSEEEVGAFEDELNNFLLEVESNIQKIIDYTPLLKVKNDMRKIFNYIYEWCKDVDVNDKKIMNNSSITKTPNNNNKNIKNTNKNSVEKNSNNKKNKLNNNNTSYINQTPGNTIYLQMINIYINNIKTGKKQVDCNDMIKIKRGITKDIFTPWKEEYNKTCDTLLTLETERTFTRFVRKAVQNVAWFGNKLYSFLKVIKPF